MGWRFKMFGWRLLEFIFGWPFRIWRLVKWMLWIETPRGEDALIRWVVGLALLFFDLTPVGLFYETILDFVKWNSRPINLAERQILEQVFGKGFPYRLVSLDDSSLPVKKGRTTAYVSFHTINFFETLPETTLIHEMVHIWQYRRYGSIYISESVWAQKWGGGYNYGGLDMLLQFQEQKGLRAFNFEQQADIIEDWYRWKNGMTLQWAVNIPGIGSVLEKYKKAIET